MPGYLQVALHDSGSPPGLKTRRAQDSADVILGRKTSMLLKNAAIVIAREQSDRGNLNPQS